MLILLFSNFAKEKRTMKCKKCITMQEKKEKKKREKNWLLNLIISLKVKKKKNCGVAQRCMVLSLTVADIVGSCQNQFSIQLKVC